jgi:hypothetical protein
MVREYSAMIVPSVDARGFHIHLAPRMFRGLVPANYYRNREELIDALSRLKIKPDLKAEILESMENGKIYHVPCIELPDELATQFGWNFS